MCNQVKSTDGHMDTNKKLSRNYEVVNVVFLGLFSYKNVKRMKKA